MKIYNRNNFVHGLFMVLLGSAFIPLGLLRGSLDWRDYVLAGGLLLMGGGLLIRSASKKPSEEDLLEERDERNRLVLLKNRSCAFRVVEYGCLALETVFFAAGKIAENTFFIHMGCGLAVALGLCLFADLATFIYYDSKL